MIESRKPAEFGSREVTSIVALLGAAAVALATAELGWASYSAGSVRLMPSSGPSLAALASSIVAGVASVVLITHRSRLLQWFRVAAAGSTLVFAVVLALSRISEANSALGTNVGTTSYGVGALVGVLGAGLLLVASILGLLLSHSDGTTGSPRSTFSPSSATAR